MSGFEHIRFDIEQGIATIELCRPDALNAFTMTMWAELLEAFDRTDEDDDVRAVIVTGEGDKAFCAGVDLSGGASTFEREPAVDDGTPKVPREPGGVLALRIFRSLKPVIGAINGAAVGIGATLTLPMDVRIASSQARFGFVFARIGVVPEAASSWFLPRVVGIGRALEWCFSGRLVSANEALAAGLVHELHEPAELLPAARALAASFVESTSPVSIALTRQMLWRMLGADHPMQAHKLDSRAMFSLGASADVREGVSSFLERRPARFTDRVSSDAPDIFAGWPEPCFD